LLDVSKSSSSHSETSTNIVQLAEHDLGTAEDSCMSMAVVRLPASNNSNKKKSKVGSNVKLLAGVNSAEAQQREEGSNQHFRVFSIADNAITAETKKQLFASHKGVDVYQRVLRTRGSLAAVASGGGKSDFELVVVSTFDYSVKRQLATDSEVADLDLSDDADTLAYCTAKEIFVTPAVGTSEPKKLNFQPTPPIPGSFRSLRFWGKDRIVAVLNAPMRTGTELLLLDATSGAIVARKKLHNGIKAATGLDVADLGGSCVIAVSGADQSLEILSFEASNTQIKRAQLFREVHPFQISRVVISPTPPPPPTPAAAAVEEKEETRHIIRVATTSVGNSVVVHTLPLVSAGSGYALLRSGAVAKQTAISVLLSLVAVVVFAVLLQVVFVARGGMGGGLHGLGDFIPTTGRLSEAAKGLEKDVDAFIAGLKSGAATDPFDGGAVVEEESIRDELLKEAGVTDKEEL
jgi:hypothetical protein